MYEMQNLVTQEIKDIYFLIDDAPPLGAIIQFQGQGWKRILTRAPYGIVKESENPMSPQAFVEKTGKQKGTVGDLFDQSRELSEKRKKTSINGRDPVQDKYFDSYSKKRGGKQHPADDRPKPKSQLKKNGKKVK